MAFRDSWHRALVYFGLAEDRDVYEDVEPIEPEAELEDRYRERPSVRRLPSSRRRRDEFDDIFADDDAPAARTTTLRPVAGGRAAPARNGKQPVPPVIPQSFNDAPQTAE